jgi:hypothetical protein
MDMAVKLYQYIEGIQQGYFIPEDEPEDPEDYPDFDEDDPEHLKQFYERIMQLYDSANLLRVIWGFLVLTDPQNAIIDPDDDCLALHPKIVEALTLLEEKKKDGDGKTQEETKQEIQSIEVSTPGPYQT